MLHDFSNNLTLELAQIIQSDLSRLSSTLLKLFQVTGKASEWIMSLAEGELDGAHHSLRNHQQSSSACQQPPGTSSSSHSVSTLADAPLSGSCTGAAEAKKHPIKDINTLFRGNTLLTKSLDAHMRRLGREYLEDVLGEHLRKIAEEDILCEVDPMKISNLADLEANWKTLLSITRAIWESIYSSHDKCPLELRRILRHIRGLVEARYGDTTPPPVDPSVPSQATIASYSSVSGFLFLRFFCPAVLNPKLFSLLKDHPSDRAQRTLTLIAKSLQGLANMSNFGIKEPWMRPMNEFVAEHGPEFRDFVESVIRLPPGVADGPSKTPAPAPGRTPEHGTYHPSYAAPMRVLEKLSPARREGFPSLPYLIDEKRCYAGLVTMWLRRMATMRNKEGGNGTGSGPGWKSEGVAKWDAECRRLKERIRGCVEGAELRVGQGGKGSVGPTGGGSAGWLGGLVRRR